jgi:hypothetical protein
VKVAAAEPLKPAIQAAAHSTAAELAPQRENAKAVRIVVSASIDIDNEILSSRFQITLNRLV